LEVKKECTGHRCIQKTEPVLARLYVEVRPWLAVDMDDIAIERRFLGSRAEERTIAFVLLGCQDERDVELAIPRWQVESVFGRVVKYIPPCLAFKVSRVSSHTVATQGYHHTEIRIHGSMLDGMIMIPQEPPTLAVRVVVVLELPRGNNIFCPTVPRGALHSIMSEDVGVGKKV
jgi:hypothetical protein